MGSAPDAIEIYDTTLRDGSQLEGISLTVEDKLKIAQQLDRLGVHYIEGGWPGANTKDDEFFARAKDELKLENSTFVAFGSTRRVKGKVDEDQTLEKLLAADTEVVCIVGKCWDYHVTEALRTTLDEGVAMVADSLARALADRRFGIAIEAMMAMIATTIISSISVKPDSFVWCFMKASVGFLYGAKSSSYSIVPIGSTRLATFGFAGLF